MSPRLVLALFAQLLGLLLAGVIATLAWGALGAGGWLALLLYLTGDVLAEQRSPR